MVATYASYSISMNCIEPEMRGRPILRKMLALLLTLILLVPSVAMACTTIIIGRDVSADGSLIYGRTADGEEFQTTQIVTVPAKKLDAPQTFVCKYNGFTMELPAESC